MPTQPREQMAVDGGRKIDLIHIQDTIYHPHLTDNQYRKYQIRKYWKYLEVLEVPEVLSLASSSSRSSLDGLASGGKKSEKLPDWVWVSPCLLVLYPDHLLSMPIPADIGRYNIIDIISYHLYHFFKDI
jgi:hypothetical protein